MRICAIDACLTDDLEEQGHIVLRINSGKQVVINIEEELAKHSFQPELIFQQESLGARTLCSGLSKFTCPKIFWSIDTHLNLYWHRYYVRQFDAVMTPHIDFFDNPPAPVTTKCRIARLAYPAPDIVWIPWSRRHNRLGFVGRLTQHRPLRQKMVAYLSEKFDLLHLDGVSQSEMFQFYGDTDLVPNEAIMGEVNFRLLESAGCGCLSLTYADCPDGVALLRPEQECLTFENALELDERIKQCLSHPEYAEKLARSGWERVQSEHLSRHCAAKVVRLGTELSAAGNRSGSSDADFYMSLYWLQRGSSANNSMALGSPIKTDPISLLQKLLCFEPSEEVLIHIMRIWMENCFYDQAKELLRSALVHSEEPGGIEYNLTMSMAGMLLNDWTAARYFYYKQRDRQSKTAGLRKPENNYQLCLFWAEELVRHSWRGWPGLRFEPGKHLAATAVDCLLQAQHENDGNLTPEIARMHDQICARLKGYDHQRLSLLSHLSLHFPDDWRIGLDLALVNLKCYRISQGLEELQLALIRAESSGQGKSFRRVLKARDAGNFLSDYLRRK